MTSTIALLLLLLLLLVAVSHPVNGATFGTDPTVCTSNTNDNDAGLFVLNTDPLYTVSGSSGTLTSVDMYLLGGVNGDAIHIYRMRPNPTIPTYTWTFITSFGLSSGQGTINGHFNFPINTGTILNIGDTLGFYFVGSVSSCRILANELVQSSDPIVNDPLNPITLTNSNPSNGIVYSFTTTTSTVTGDPQFIGLQGQQYQIHGIPDEYFALISYTNMQVNAKFAYLDSGACTYNNTQCWTHPGTYISEVGVMFPGLRLELISGSHTEGCQLFIDNQLHSSPHIHDIPTNDNRTVTLRHTYHDQVTIITELVTFTLTNSDMFFNFALELHAHGLLKVGRPIHHIMDQDTDPYPSFPLHGLIGQTWRNARFGLTKSMYQGQAEDYLVQDGLWGTQFQYNQYQP